MSNMQIAEKCSLSTQRHNMDKQLRRIGSTLLELVFSIKILKYRNSTYCCKNWKARKIRIDKIMGAYRALHRATFLRQ